MTDPLDDLGTPRCPEHLVLLVDEGTEPDGSDARWTCPVPGCTWVQVA